VVSPNILATRKEREVLSNEKRKKGGCALQTWEAKKIRLNAGMMGSAGQRFSHKSGSPRTRKVRLPIKGR